MKPWLSKISPREMVLLCGVVLLALSFLCYYQWILPAYNNWRSVRSDVQARRVQYSELSRFLQVRTKVAAEYATLDPSTFQLDSDPVTLSLFLRHVESLARQPSLQIVNAKPEPVESSSHYRRFPIRLSIAGKLPEVCQFVTELLSGNDIAGLESFTLRGVQGNRTVECSLALWMVRLSPLKNNESAVVVTPKSEPDRKESL